MTIPFSLFQYSEVVAQSPTLEREVQEWGKGQADSRIELEIVIAELLCLEMRI